MYCKKVSVWETHHLFSIDCINVFTFYFLALKRTQRTLIQATNKAMTYTATLTTKKIIMTRMLKTFRKQTVTIMMTMTKMTIRVTTMMKKIQIDIRNENRTRKVRTKIEIMTKMILREQRVMMIMMRTTKTPVTPERRIPLQWSIWKMSRYTMVWSAVWARRSRSSQSTDLLSFIGWKAVARVRQITPKCKRF